MLASFLVAALAASAATAQTTTSTSAQPARTLYIQVGNNQSATNGTDVFKPRLVQARLGDTVIFNFTAGNRSVNQAVFYAPCQPAHDVDPTINGFMSGPRITEEGAPPTILSVPITPEIENKTLWFYDVNTCFIGGVGGINVNQSSNETLDGFTRNAIRLNGTGGGSSSSSRSMSRTSTGASPTGTGSDSSDATRTLVSGALVAVPLFLAALAL